VPKDVKKKVKTLKHILVVDSDDYRQKIKSSSDNSRLKWFDRKILQ